MDRGSEIVQLTRWGPIEGCSTVGECNECDKSDTQQPHLVKQKRANKDIEFRATLGGKPSCGDPPKRLNHTGSTSTLSFPGIGSETSNFFHPYSSIAIGRNYILQAAGTQIGVYNKQGRHFATIPVGDNIFYNTVTEQVLAVLYDPYSDRFVIAVNRVRNTDDPVTVVDPYIGFAISKGSNPLSDGWYRYMLPLDAPGTRPFQLKLGAWHDGIYLSVFNDKLSRMAVINRESILCGDPLVALYCVGGNKTTMPPNVGVTLPPKQESGYFASFEAEHVDLTECRINWDKFSGQARKICLSLDYSLAGIGVAAQNETNVKIVYGLKTDTGSQMQAQYSHIDGRSSYWVSMANKDGLVWLEIVVKKGCKPKIAQQQQILNDGGLVRFSSSMAVNKSGSVVLTATQSSALTFPSTVYFYRFHNDPPNLMTKANILIEGTGSATHVTVPVNGTVWGYNSVQVDPVDTTTFFVCGEWYKTTTSDWWSTTVKNLKL